MLSGMTTKCVLSDYYIKKSKFKNIALRKLETHD